MADAVKTPPSTGPGVPRHRFGIAYLALAAITGAAVGLFVLLAFNGKDSAPPWSAWEPTKDGVPRLDEIGQYVTRQYALPSGRALVGAISTPPTVQLGNNLAAVGQVGVASGLRGDPPKYIDASSVWSYELRGLGEQGAVAEGDASPERGRLLQRAAIELSLYTFKFEPRIDYVITYFPPVKGAASPAVFLSREALKESLAHPLVQTLPPPRTRLKPGDLTGSDLAVIGRYITHAYSWMGEQAQDGSPVLILRPVT